MELDQSWLEVTQRKTIEHKKDERINSELNKIRKIKLISNTARINALKEME